MTGWSARPCGPRRTRAVVSLLGLVLVVLLVPAAGASPTVDDPPAPRRVLVVTLPRLTWEGLGSTTTPNLTNFLSEAAIASMSTRTVGPRTDSSGAYLTLGAGNRADSLDPLTAGEAADVGEVTSSGPAAAVYQRRTGNRWTATTASCTGRCQERSARRWPRAAIPWGSWATRMRR